MNMFTYVLHSVGSVLKRFKRKGAIHTPHKTLTAYKQGTPVKTVTGETGVVVKVIRDLKSADIKFYSVMWDKPHKGESVTLLFPANELQNYDN